jgi:hypothetical protein
MGRQQKRTGGRAGKKKRTKLGTGRDVGVKGKRRKGPGGQQDDRRWASYQAELDDVKMRNEVAKKEVLQLYKYHAPEMVSKVLEQR